MTDARDQFTQRWRGLSARLGFDPEQSENTLDFLLQRYSVPGRFYHTVTHINQMLGTFDELQGKFADGDAVLCAIFFHDAIYDPARKDNEEQSAIAAREHLTRLGMGGGERVDSICAMVRATQHHRATGDQDTDLMLDIDMSILGAPIRQYMGYARNVRKEYLAAYTQEEYAYGRTLLFINPTLTAERVFITPEFSHLEQQARENLAWEKSWLPKQTRKTGR